MCVCARMCIYVYGHCFTLQQSVVTSCWLGYITHMPNQWVNFLLLVGEFESSAVICRIQLLQEVQCKFRQQFTNM